MTIRFGTSGWRAVIANDFTFAGVRTGYRDNLHTFADSIRWSGGVARSVASSHLVDRVAESRGLPVYETPVGFKHIGELINEDKIILGGEESAGLSIKGHYPEKDGILACLLAAEAVAASGASVAAQLNALYATVSKLEAEELECG